MNELQREIDDLNSKLAHDVTIDYKKKYLVVDKYIYGGDVFLDLGSGRGDSIDLLEQELVQRKRIYDLIEECTLWIYDGSR